MRLWHAERTDSVDYDEDDAVVIRAVDEEQAREVLMTGSYGRPCPGFREGNYTLTPLTQDGELGIIIRSYNAG